MRYFLESFFISRKNNLNNFINYIAFVPTKEMKSLLIKKVPEIENLSIITEEKFLDIFHSKNINLNMMLLSVIAPFLSNDDYIIFLDNDTLPFINFQEMIKFCIDKYNLNNRVLLRRPWFLTENNLGYIFANKYYNSSLREYVSGNGNGGVVIYNGLLYREIFENNVYNLINELSIFIDNIIDFKLNYLKVKEIGRDIFLDDEWFLNIYTSHNSPALLANRYNYSLNLGLEEANKIISSQKDFIFHIADNPKGIKEKIYNCIDNNKFVKFDIQESKLSEVELEKFVNRLLLLINKN